MNNPLLVVSPLLWFSFLSLCDTSAVPARVVSFFWSNSSVVISVNRTSRVRGLRKSRVTVVGVSGKADGASGRSPITPLPFPLGVLSRRIPRLVCHDQVGPFRKRSPRDDLLPSFLAATGGRSVLSRLTVVERSNTVYNRFLSKVINYFSRSKTISLKLYRPSSTFPVLKYYYRAPPTDVCVDGRVEGGLCRGVYPHFGCTVTTLCVSCVPTVSPVRNVLPYPETNDDLRCTSPVHH